jgi:hypothetical protein
LPELISLYEAHADHRDKFAVFAVHDQSVKSFAELDKKLPKIRDRFWQGKDLPFPVLLDASGNTEKLYGIRAHPTALLIDPDGRLVGESSAADLEAKLPPLTAEKQWARQRDLQKNVAWSFEPRRTTLKKLADILKLWARCPVSLDTEAVRASGLTPDGPLPGVLIGNPVTLRSVVEVLLEPHGLGVVPAADGKTLLITRRPSLAEPESYLQKLRDRELTQRLDHASSETPASEARPLDIRDETLLDAMKRIRHEFDIPVALDARAMHDKELNPETRVSGRIMPAELRKSLNAMLEPLGLHVNVGHEAVVVTLKNR